MRTGTWLAVVTILLALGGCGGDDPAAPSAAQPSSSESPGASASAAPEATAEVLGEDAGFVAGGGGAGPLEVSVNERECVVTEALFGSCRAGSGDGGDFVVTAEGSMDSASEWNIVVRCGLEPAVPAASVLGEFTPVITDLGLADYGDVIGITLLDGPDSRAALVYQPEGAECPVVWGLGPVDEGSFFTGGTDALNGSESPLAFRGPGGVNACAVPDGQGGITVGKPRGDGCG